MSPVVLCSALFGVAKNKLGVADGKKVYIRSNLECTFKTTNGATIEYRGPELGQDDLTVLLALLNKHWGMAISCPIEFAPSTFCSDMNWSDSKHNKLRLKECLLRLRGAFLIIRATKKAEDREKSKLAKAIGSGWTLGFVSDFMFDGESRWIVKLNEGIGQLFGGTETYLIAAKRKALTTGIQTWLYGYVAANTCAYAIPLQTLHDASGSAAPLKEFARQVRDALPKLAEIGVVHENSTVKNGKVAIFKVTTAHRRAS
jgi:hypothetical protein